MSQIRANSELRIKLTFAKSATNTNEWRVEAFRDAQNAENGEIASNWNVSGKLRVFNTAEYSDSPASMEVICNQ